MARESDSRHRSEREKLRLAGIRATRAANARIAARRAAKAARRKK